MKKNTFNFKNLLNFREEGHVKFSLACASSLLVLILIYLTDPEKASKKSPHIDSSSVNLTLMIPEGHLLFGFEAENYEQVAPLLGPYNMVKVYDPKHGRLIAENIKVLRAPKDPSQLSFLVPVNIANHFANFGLEYRIVLQKYESYKKPHLVIKKSKTTHPRVTYGGGLKNEDF